MRTQWSSVVITLVLFTPAVPGRAQPASPPEGVRVFSSEEADALAWDARIMAMEAAGELYRVRLQQDTLAPGWLHERLEQRYRGLEVFGAQLIRHWHNGRVQSVNGVYYRGIDIDTTPGIGPGEAGLAAERAAGREARAVDTPELLIYPGRDRFFLAYRLHVRTREDLVLFLIDAADGTVVTRWSDRRTQKAVVGRGEGTWKDIKKMSTTENGQFYMARDGLRPAVAWTVDVQGNYDAWNRYQLPGPSHPARDPDNDWRDGAVVDAHVYAGWAYDYYYKRFSRHGVNDANLPVTSYVHFWPRRFGAFPPLSFNAFWDPVDRSMNYGDGDGTRFNYFCSALDVVVHELTHGVTQFTADFIYRNESGALDEAFSDIMATGAEFFFEPRGFGRQHADWGAGEDLFMENFVDRHWRVIRYLANPAAVNDPDHYSLRYVGSEDNGGVHINSTIVSHAFYLFVEGGTNQTSGINVDGIGFDNIEHAEKIFYRGFTAYLFPSSTFSGARQATLRAARELYGADSTEARQLEQAWNAVGVQ